MKSRVVPKKYLSLITQEAIEESISIAFQEAQHGNTEHAHVRAYIAQAQAILLLVGRLDKLLAQLSRWDCGNQLAVSVRESTGGKT